MRLIGLTGSIGMGKSQTAQIFVDEGVPVYDADATVHELYAKNGAAVKPVGALFPSAVVDGAIDRQKLAAIVLKDADALKQLEDIVHPMAGAAQVAFLQKHYAEGKAAVALDIPLLLEAGGSDRVDVVIVVSAPYEIQRARVLARPNMSEEKFNDIFKKQLPDEKKRELADFIVDSSVSIDDARRQVRDILEQLKSREGSVLAKHLGS